MDLRLRITLQFNLIFHLMHKESRLWSPSPYKFDRCRSVHSWEQFYETHSEYSQLQIRPEYAPSVLPLSAKRKFFSLPPYKNPIRKFSYGRSSSPSSLKRKKRERERRKGRRICNIHFLVVIFWMKLGTDNAAGFKANQETGFLRDEKNPIRTRNELQGELMHSRKNLERERERGGDNTEL